MSEKKVKSSKKSRVSRKTKTSGMFEAPPKEFITEKLPFDQKSVKDILLTKMKDDISRLEKDTEKYNGLISINKTYLEKIEPMNKQELKDFLFKEDIDLSYVAKRKYQKPKSGLSKEEIKESIKDYLNTRIQGYESDIQQNEKTITNLRNPENLKILETIFQMEKDIYDKFVKQIKSSSKEVIPYDDVYEEFIGQYMTYSPFPYERETKKDSWIVDWNDVQSTNLVESLKPYEGKVVFLSGGSGAMGIHGDYSPVILEKIERVPIPEEQLKGKEMNEWEVHVTVHSLDIHRPAWRGGLFATVYTARSPPSFLSYLTSDQFLKIEEKKPHLGSWRIDVLPDYMYGETKGKLKTTHQKLTELAHFMDFDEEQYERFRNDFNTEIKKGIDESKIKGLILGMHNLPSQFDYGFVYPDQESIEKAFVDYYELKPGEEPASGLTTAYFDFATGKSYEVYYKKGRTDFTMKEIKEKE